jgi:FkbM family methyltransferase
MTTKEIYYYCENYLKPITIYFKEDNTVKVISSYWEDDFGTYDENKIYFNRLGTGIIKENKIEFGIDNLWEKDKRKNILFIGANDMCEIKDYVNKYNNGLFIEAIPYTYDRLKINLENTKNYNTNYIPINCLVTSEEGKEYNFKIFNNNEGSSSIFEPNPEFWKWSDVKVKDEIKITSTTVEKILKDYKWENLNYDLMLDVQGAELEVLKGFGENNLKNIQDITVEVSTKSFYKGGVLFDDLNKFLNANKFRLVSSLSSDHCDVKFSKI